MSRRTRRHLRHLDKTYCEIIPVAKQFQLTKLWALQVDICKKMCFFGMRAAWAKARAERPLVSPVLTEKSESESVS